MSGIARAARTIPGSVAPLASCSSEASLLMDAISRSSATTRPGTRMPRRSSRGIRQSWGPTCSSCMRRRLRSAGGGGRRAAPRPREPHDGDEDAGDARELGDAEGAQPEAVEPQPLDREPAQGVEAEVAEEERARPPAQARAQPGDEERENEEVPDRLVEERRVEVVVLGEAERPVRSEEHTSELQSQFH